MAAEVASLTKQLGEANQYLGALRGGQESAEKKAAELSRQLEIALSLLTREKPQPPPEAPQTSPAPLSDEKKAARLGGLDSLVQEPPAKPAAVESKVVDVQGKGLIISAGWKAGIREGWDLEIRREGALVARAQVSRISQDMSGALVTALEAGKEIRIGDLVIARPK